MLGLQPGPVRLQAKLGKASSEVVELVLEADRASELVQLVLVERQSSFEIQVVSAAGVNSAAAFVFLESDGRGLRQLTSDRQGWVAVALHPPYPERLRVAAWSDGTWAFGSWLGLEQAAAGIRLELQASGAVELTCTAACEGPRIYTADGWELTALSRRLGCLLRLFAERPLLIAGLQPGAYRVETEFGGFRLVVEEGSTESLELP